MLAEDGLDAWAVDNLLAYLTEQREATRHLPDDRTILVERFRDELGDWRMTVHCVLGAKVNSAWALAIGQRLQERYGVDAQVMPSDDGIVVRLPDIVDEAPGADLVAFAPDEIAAIVEESVGGSAMFASRFRECAARALLLPKRDPRRRAPLWQQRQRAAQLLDVARDFGDFPITLEAARECLQDVFDVPALVEVMRDLESRKMRLVEVETARPSPFARSLLFGYVGAFLYEGDAPLAERRAAALSLDSTLLGELLGRVDLRELLDPAVVAETEARLQFLTDGSAATRRRGRGRDSAPARRPVHRRGRSPRHRRVLADGAGRATAGSIAVRIAGEQRWLPIEDAGRVRDALGVALPVGIAEAYTASVADPLGDLVARYARTHAPFAAATCAARFGLGVFVVEQALRRLAASGRLTSGEFTPGGAGAEFCDAEVLRLLRRRSLAALRKEIEPVAPEALARFLPAWQHVGSSARGVAAVGQRDRAAPGRRAAGLGAGEAGAAGPGRRLLPGVPRRAVRLRRGGVGRLRRDRRQPTAGSIWRTRTRPRCCSRRRTRNWPAARCTRRSWTRSTAARRCSSATCPTGSKRSTDADVAAAIWDLVWAGYLSNDTIAPLRALLAGGTGAHKAQAAPGRSRYRRLGRPGLVVGTSCIAPSASPSMAGRWYRLPDRDTDPDPPGRRHRRRAARTPRRGHPGRGDGRRRPGGFAGVYPVLGALEERGVARRGYFVEGLGAAQFAVPGAVDRLRSLAERPSRVPAPSFWPAPIRPIRTAPRCPGRTAPSTTDPRPGRRAGIAPAGRPARWWCWSTARSPSTSSAAARPCCPTPTIRTRWLAAKALADAVHAGALGSLSVERADGASVHASPLRDALTAAGFRVTPRGLRLRG